MCQTGLAQSRLLGVVAGNLKQCRKNKFGGYVYYTYLYCIKLITMQTKVQYEWTLETLEDGDIINSDFSDNLTFDKADLVGKDLGLVRNEGNEEDGVTDRIWAYVKDGKLPECFSDSMGTPIAIKVPQRFHNELKKYFEL